MQIPSRGLRRASLALALGLSGLAVSASTAAAAASVNFGNSADGAGVSYSDDSSGTAPHINLVRGGSVLAQADGFSFGSSRFASLSLPDNGQLASGDQLQVVIDGVTQAFTYNGLPSISADACNGATSFTGSVDAAASKVEAGGWRMGLGSAPGDFTATVDHAGTTFTAKLGQALLTGDFLGVTETTSQNGIDVFTSASIKVPGGCPVPAAPAPAPATKTATALPTATQILAGLQTALGKQATVLSKLDIAQLAGRSSVNVPFSFLVPGTVKFVWLVNGAGARSARVAKAKAKTKALKLAAGAATSATAGSVKVRMKLSRAGKKLLRHAKKVRVTFTAAFTPAAGGPIQRTQKKFTLKKHAHKKGKKH
jgi:carbon monoxide dehydrogenase subunit G